MINISIFNYRDYKKYLRAWIAARPSRGRGEKRRFAEALDCNSAYISQVFEHDANFSLEQAAVLAAYLDLNALEARYFLLLVQRERAGNRVLGEHLDAQIHEIVATRLSMRHRISHKDGLSIEAQAIYFSSWDYSAVHILLLIPEIRTKDAISMRLGIPLAKTTKILDFLVSAGLARQEGGQYFYGAVQIFVPDSSPLSAKSHINWRLKAMGSLDTALPDELHYTSVAAVNRSDVGEIRAVLMTALEEVRRIVRESKNEDTLICYDLDLFRP